MFSCSLVCPTAGTYALSATSCPNCAAGSWSAANAASCTSCSNGQYSTAGSSGCTTCPAGTTLAGVGTSSGSCNGCSAGTASTGGTNPCASCPGQAQPHDWQRPLLTGFFDCMAGPLTRINISFLLCSFALPAGKYSGANAGSCSTCSAGTYSTGGTSSCPSCSNGYWSLANSGSCTQCGGGTYLAGVGTSSGSCNTCPAGSWCGGGTHIFTCTAGTYSSSPSQSTDTCTPCPAGSWCGGGSAVTGCSSGYYRLTTGASAAGHCLQCPCQAKNTCTQTTLAGSQLVLGSVSRQLVRSHMLCRPDCLLCPDSQPATGAQPPRRTGAEQAPGPPRCKPQRSEHVGHAQVRAQTPLRPSTVHVLLLTRALTLA